MRRGLLLAWALFGAAAVLLIATAGWLTKEALRLERERADAQQEAALQEKMRAVLWRIDSYVAPLLAAETAWTLYGVKPLASEGLPPGWRSRRQVIYPQGKQWETEPKQPAAALEYNKLIAGVPGGAAALPVSIAGARVEPPVQSAANSPSASNKRSDLDYQNRAEQTVLSQQAFQMVVSNALYPQSQGTTAATSQSEPLRPFWFQESLVLAARMADEPNPPLRISILEWEPLRKHLEGLVQDLLPGTRLRPWGGGEAEEEYWVASLPLAVEPLRPQAPAERGQFRGALTAAWSGILLGIGALGLLLGGVLSLSERRHRFVSSVTHELRTPLTTFQLYSEMLRDGMVPPEKQSEYYETLRRESVRLQHLVENVLAYARLERRGLAGRSRVLRLSEMLEGVRPPLEERAREAGLPLRLTAEDPDAMVRADPGAVEQILFNLVDNACKYATGGEEPRIEIAAATTGRYVRIRVRDYGPGFSRPRMRLILPFSVSAEEAAERGQPGVGLGLQLSRRLARAMGGRLQFEPVPQGTCLTLQLPRVRQLSRG